MWYPNERSQSSHQGPAVKLDISMIFHNYASVSMT